MLLVLNNILVSNSTVYLLYLLYWIATSLNKTSPFLSFLLHCTCRIFTFLYNGSTVSLPDSILMYLSLPLLLSAVSTLFLPVLAGLPVAVAGLWTCGSVFHTDLSSWFPGAEGCSGNSLHSFSSETEVETNMSVKNCLIYNSPCWIPELQH